MEAPATINAMAQVTMIDGTVTVYIPPDQVPNFGFSELQATVPKKPAQLLKKIARGRIVIGPNSCCLISLRPAERGILKSSTLAKEVQVDPVAAWINANKKYFSGGTGSGDRTWEAEQRELHDLDSDASTVSSELSQTSFVPCVCDEVCEGWCLRSGSDEEDEAEGEDEHIVEHGAEAEGRGQLEDNEQGEKKMEMEAETDKDNVQELEYDQGIGNDSTVSTTGELGSPVQDEISMDQTCYVSETDDEVKLEDQTVNQDKMEFKTPTPEGNDLRLEDDSSFTSSQSDGFPEQVDAADGLNPVGVGLPIGLVHEDGQMNDKALEVYAGVPPHLQALMMEMEALFENVNAQEPRVVIQVPQYPIPPPPSNQRVVLCQAPNGEYIMVEVAVPTPCNCGCRGHRCIALPLYQDITKQYTQQNGPGGGAGQV